MDEINKTNDTTEQLNVENSTVNENVVADSGSLLGDVKINDNDITNDDVNIHDKSQENIEKDIEYVDFSIPENVEINKELLEQFKPLAKELKLTQEQAQKLVDMQVKETLRINEIQKQEFEEAKKAYADETKNMLGVNYEKELRFGAIAIDKLLSKEEQPKFREFLDISGIGNHPLYVKMMINMGKQLSEDTLVQGNSAKKIKSDGEILFGELKNKNKEK